MKSPCSSLLLVVASIAVLASVMTCEARVAVIASGGGIRATYGTLLTLQALKQEKLLGNVDEFIGLSGGAWGVAWFERANQDIDKLVTSITSSKDWGKFTEFSPVKCGRNDGWFSWSCHKGWVKSIQKDLFKDSLTDDFELSRTITNADTSKKQTVSILIDTCHHKTLGKLRGKMEHDGQCIIRNKEVTCVPFVKTPEGQLKYEDRKIKMANYKYDSIEVRPGGDKDKFVKTTAWDLLGFTSSAWAEVGDNTGGILEKNPATCKMAPEDTSAEKERGTKEYVGSFCDSGATCNIPLAILIGRETEQIGNRIHRAMLFDFSDDSKPLEAWNQCVKFWEDSLNWKVPEKPTVHDWGFTTNIRLDKRFGIKSSITIDYFAFRGKNLGGELIKKFPTMQFDKSPTWYGEKEIKLFDSEWGAYIRELAAKKDGPLAPLRE